MKMKPPRSLRGLRRAIFARHSHPWSAWTRWASAPLVLLPVWTRNWRHAAAIATWFALNPVIFPEPADRRAWATRAMLGEELWISERPNDTALAINAAATVAGVVAIAAARQRRALPAGIATVAQMSLLLVYWELMAQYFERNTDTDDDGGPVWFEQKR